MASLVAPVLLFPAMLGYLGTVDFGLWASGLAVVGLAAILDFGVGNAILTLVAKAHAQQDDQLVRRYLTGGYLILGIVSGVGLSSIALLTLFGVDTLFRTSSGWPIIATALVGFFITLPLSLIYRIIYAYQRIPLHSFLQVCGAALSVITSFGAIAFRLPAWAVVAAYSLAPALVMCGTTIWFFGQQRAVAISVSDFDRPSTSELFGSGMKFFILSILTAFGTNADIVLISLLVGPEAVANFVPPMRIGSVLSVLVINLFMPLWSFNADALARGQNEWVRRNSVAMSAGAGLMVLIGGSLVVYLSHDIMRLWMGTVFYDQNLVLGGMVLFAAVTAITSPFNMILNAKGMASVQIHPWLLFVVLSIAGKAGLIIAGHLALTPASAAVLYLLIITPAMIRQGLRALDVKATRIDG